MKPFHRPKNLTLILTSPNMHIRKGPMYIKCCTMLLQAAAVKRFFFVEKVC